MRFARLLPSFVLATSLLNPTAAPQTAQNAPLAVQYLHQALTALGGNTPLTDVALTGSAHYIAGSDDETGTATLKAVVGASRMDLSLSSGSYSEIQNRLSGSPIGAWSGPTGLSHPMAYHNLLTDPVWFFPAFPIAGGLSPNYVATYIGHETRNGQTVEHVSVTQTSPAQPSPGSTLSQHLTQVDFFLDFSTLLPAAITFSTHPDDNALLDIPVEVQFSNYRAVNGVQIPFHVKKYLNNSLLLDLQFQTVVLNAGLSATTFSVQ